MKKTTPTATANSADGKVPHAMIAPLQAAMGGGRWADAEQFALHLIATYPQDAELLVIAGEVAGQSHRWDVAAQRYNVALQLLPDSPAIELRLRAAEASARALLLTDSIEHLQRVLEIDPNNQRAHLEISGVLSGMGLMREAQQHLHWLLQQGKVGTEELILLADPIRADADEAWCQQAIIRLPSDLRPMMARVHNQLRDSKWDEVANNCREILKLHPKFLPAWLALGRALAEQGNQEAVRTWFAERPEFAEQQPGYWFILGMTATDHYDDAFAAHCFFEAVCLEPGFREALSKLIPLLVNLGNSSLAKEVTSQLSRLELLDVAVANFMDWKKQGQRPALQAAAAMAQLGRYWEAEAWGRVALACPVERDASAATQHTALAKQLRAGLPLVSKEHHPERWRASFSGPNVPDVDQWLEKNLLAINSSSNNYRAEQSISESSIDSSVRLADEAAMRGILVTYANGDDPNQPGLQLYQSNGGGVAAIDFDQDGWIDVCVSQAGGEPLARADSQPNQLFQNLGGKFCERTNESGVGDRGFGQGLAVGDFNDDGFSDLALANIGQNVLLKNNGDGTFSDVTEVAKLTGQRWTTSMAMADVSGDNIVDIFEVNYCAGNDALFRECLDQDDPKIRQPCTPREFAPEQDRLWLGVGDGSFRDVTDTMLVGTEPGRGLGISIANFDGQGDLDTFIANDMSANHFWQQTIAGERLEETAAIRGLASSDRGRVQACMGVATGDADCDGDIDLVVTNFANEANCFYEQLRPGCFADRSAASRLAEPSFAMLGFGTQMADFDGDGHQELIVTNGHIIDYQQGKGIYEMPTQVFSFTDRWRELDAESLGPYFQKQRVGRSLALLDANRDGWPDAVVYPLIQPLALLVNQSLHKRRPLVLDLVALKSPRDAIGARIELDANDRKTTRWVFAGDGFQCSNQRQTWFAVDATTEAIKINVDWPSGESQTYSLQIAGDGLLQYLLVESRDEPLSRRR